MHPRAPPVGIPSQGASDIHTPQRGKPSAPIYCRPNRPLTGRTGCIRMPYEELSLYSSRNARPLSNFQCSKTGLKRFCLNPTIFPDIYNPTLPLTPMGTAYFQHRSVCSTVEKRRRIGWFLSPSEHESPAPLPISRRQTTRPPSQRHPRKRSTSPIGRGTNARVGPRYAAPHGKPA